MRRNEVGSFLLLAILATSASDTPAVIRRYGGEAQAQNVGQRYFEQALTVAIAEIAEPSLERIQAFYLLANRDWMEGRGTRSWILMGIAIRLASVMCLEKAESYSSNDGISTDQMIAEEEARRTWVHRRISFRNPGASGTVSLQHVLIDLDFLHIQGVAPLNGRRVSDRACSLGLFS